MAEPPHARGPHLGRPPRKPERRHTDRGPDEEDDHGTEGNEPPAARTVPPTGGGETAVDLLEVGRPGPEERHLLGAGTGCRQLCTDLGRRSIQDGRDGQRRHPDTVAKDDGGPRRRGNPSPYTPGRHAGRPEAGGAPETLPRYR